MTGLATVLNLLRRGSSSVDQRAEGNKRGSLFVQKDMPDYTSLVKAGKVWNVGELTATAAVTGVPTTTAGLTLYNDEPEGSGKDYVMLAAFYTQVGNGAALNSVHLMHLPSTIKPTTKPTADIAAASIKNMKTPSGAYGGKAIVDLGATVTDDLWTPVGPFAGTTVVSLTGTSIFAWLYGLVIVEPGGQYSIESVASATGITGRLGFIWAEDVDY